ncbi:MAG: hypothetical protein WCG23_08255 [bacterium]
MGNDLCLNLRYLPNYGVHNQEPGFLPVYTRNPIVSEPLELFQSNIQAENNGISFGGNNYERINYNPTANITNNSIGDFTVNNNFGNLTAAIADNSAMSLDGLSLYNITEGFPPVYALNNGAATKAANADTDSASGDTDIAVLRQRLNKDLQEGKITPDQYIDELNKLKTKIKTYSAEEIEESKTAEKEAKDENLTKAQKNALYNHLKTTRTLTRDKFQQDPNISGAQTATENIPESQIVRTVKILADGTTVEITQDKSKEGLAAAALGNRGGAGTGIVGALEAFAGALICGTGFGAWVGVPMMADGARRIYNAGSTSQAFTAVITSPNGKKQTIQSNYREDLYSELYKNLGISK